MREELRLLKAASNPYRLRILGLLHERPLAVCEIREILGLAVSTVSSHLAILRAAGLITDFKDGKWVNYSRNEDENSEQVRAMLNMVDTWLESDPQAKEDRIKVGMVDRHKICQ